MDGHDDPAAAIATMQAHIGHLESRIAELEATLGAGGAGGPSAKEPRSGDAAVERRTVLRRSAAVALGATVAGVATAAGAQPAAAANDDPILIGSAGNVGSAPTNCRFTGGLGSAAFVFQDANYDPDQSAEEAVVAAWASDAGRSALYAFASATADDGFVARSFGSGTYAARLGGNDNARLLLEPSGAAPAARSDTYARGAITVDAAGDLWLCVQAGTPGTWRHLGGPAAVGALTLHDSPIRAYDSRGGFAPLGVVKGQLLSGNSRTIDLKVNGGVPDGAVAALVNLTATATSPAGFLRIYQAGAAVPSASSINWDHSGSNVANNATVRLNGSESCTVRCGGTLSATDFIVDVIGYYR